MMRATKEQLDRLRENAGLKTKRAVAKKPRVKVLAVSERDVQRTCEDLLELDGWRIFRLEQNYSDKKRKVIGEVGAPDAMLVRYGVDTSAEIMFVEWKKTKNGRPTKASQEQMEWHDAERARGAMTFIAGIDFEADIEGFMDWYGRSGMLKRGWISR